VYAHTVLRYKGLGPSLIGIVPYAGMDLLVNSLLKDFVAARQVSTGVISGHDL
jgi:hypothetical protein